MGSWATSMGSEGSNREGSDCGHNRETLIFTKSAGSEVLRLTGHFWEIWVWWTCLAEKAMAPHSSTLAWKIAWTEEPGRLQSMGREESDMIERLHFHFSLLCIGEGNGNPLQCSCLENPRDGVAQSRTQLK